MAYRDKVAADIARWRDGGLVTAETAEALLRDTRATHGRGLGFGQVLAIMAALLFAAAVLVTVAANWEVIPRPWRVGALFLLIAASYVGGAWLKLRDHGAMAEAAWLVGAASFGGAIALVSQMYHISGDETQAILVWCLGTVIAAAALRSPVLTAAAVALAAAWVGWPVFGSGDWVNFWFLGLLALLWAVSIWTKSPQARHLILLCLIGYLVLLFAEYDHAGYLVLLVIASVALFAAATLMPAVAERLSGLGDDGLAVDALIGFLVGMLALQFEFSDTAHFIWLAAIGLAGVVGALLIGGKLGRMLRWLAYLGFALEIATIYSVTVGSMLGTAGFFLVAALGLGILAFLIIRIERRMVAQGASS